MPSLAPALEARLQVLRVLWFAQLASVGIFTVVCALLAHAGTLGVDDPTLAGSLRRLFVILAFTFVLVASWWRRSFVESPANPVYLPVDRGGGRYGVVPSTAILGRLQVNCIIVWALSEGVAILGLVLGVLSRDLVEFLPFAAVAVALLYIHRPTAWPLERVSQAIS